MLDIGERCMRSYRRNQFSNTASVASGLQRTGGLITSLALLLIIVVGAFSASGITFIKLMGVGMIVALLVDATIIRVLLGPNGPGSRLNASSSPGLAVALATVLMLGRPGLSRRVQ